MVDSGWERKSRSRVLKVEVMELNCESEEADNDDCKAEVQRDLLANGGEV